MQEKELRISGKEKRAAAIAIGRRLAPKWRARHPDQKNPPRREQLEGGKVINVHGYYDCDRDLMEEAFTEAGF